MSGRSKAGHRESASIRGCQTDLGCWYCRQSIPDDNPECPTCWWRICSCGACRQPNHPDTRGRIGPCPEAVQRLGFVLHQWSRTFDGAAYFFARKAGYGAGDFVGGLGQVDFSPKNRLWHKIGFVTPGKSTPNARLQEVKAATHLIAEAIIPKPVDAVAS